MCGIWGYFKYNVDPKFKGCVEIADGASEQEYAERIAHRGPDQTSLLSMSFGNIDISLTFHRLAIVDIKNGNQPFEYEDGDRRIMLVANGEIYNYRELIEKYGLDTTSDCEVILRLYKDIGIERTVLELDGEFAFVLIDILDINTPSEKNINIYIVRDRFGVRPLFVGRDASCQNLYFSSELKGIPVQAHSMHVSPRKITSVYFLEERIILNAKEYYSVGDNASDFKYNTEGEQLYDAVRESLIKSVRDRMYSERPLGCLLSGGLDSSLIAGIASRILLEKNQKLNTFSIGMSRNSPDVIYARMVAEYIGSIHTEVIVPENEWLDALPKIIYQIETYDTTTIRASTGQYLLAKWISENTEVKVLLNGDGSDELASGYLYFYNAPDACAAHNENIRLLQNIHYYDVLRVDRGISAHGLEARVPFLSHHFVDMYLSIDPALRNPIKGSRIEKYLLRKSFESLCIIPSEVLWRKKEAFSDGVSLREKSWYEIIEESIVDDGAADAYVYVGSVLPQTKESKYFRRLFDHFYPQKHNILETNEYWLPKWSGTVQNPSARVLSVYE
jgi:asparagine synthase (glutamine-hydrolysing)